MTRSTGYMTQRTLVPTRDELFEGMERLLKRIHVALGMYPTFVLLREDISALLLLVMESRRPAPPACPKCGGAGAWVGTTAVCANSCWHKNPQRGKRREELE